MLSVLHISTNVLGKAWIVPFSRFFEAECSSRGGARVVSVHVVFDVSSGVEIIRFSSSGM